MTSRRQLMGRLLLSLSLTVVFELVVRSPVRAQGLVFNTFERYLESFRVQAGIPGLSAVIVGRQGIVWEGAFGQQDVQRDIATTTDTPFHLDGITQVVTASLVLRCVDDGRLSLDDTIGDFVPDVPHADATIREILTHTTAGIGGLEFDYRPDRLDSLTFVLNACSGVTFRDMFATWLDDLGMSESVPGPDAITYVPTFGFAPPVERYLGVLERLAIPYRVDDGRRFVESEYPAKTLTPASGLISTVRDFARFDLALKGDLVLLPDTRSLAWSPPSGPNGVGLPHGLGWFVQTYGGEPVVWQFGYGANASSSLVITLPTRGLTLLLLANSDALAWPFVENISELTFSLFARLFLEVFGR